MASPNAGGWKDAVDVVDEETANFKSHNVYELVPRTNGMRTLKLGYVFHRKFNNRVFFGIIRANSLLPTLQCPLGRLFEGTTGSSRTVSNGSTWVFLTGLRKTLLSHAEPLPLVAATCHPPSVQSRNPVNINSSPLTSYANHGSKWPRYQGSTTATSMDHGMVVHAID